MDSLPRARALGDDGADARARVRHRGDRGERRRRAVHHQHRPAPPGHPRRAAAAHHARGRGGARRQADHRLRPHRHREELRGPAVLEGDHVRRADGLPRLLLQRAWRSAWRWSGCSRWRCRRAPSGCACSTWSSTGSPATCSGSPPARSTSARSRCSGGAAATATSCSTCSRCRAGQRLHTRYFQVGGVMEDIPPGFEQKVREFLELMPTRHRPVRGAARPQRDLAAAHEGHRASSRRSALLELGVTGPLLRATGHPWDLRKAMPYSSYEQFDFDVPVGTVGDNYDRYKVRLDRDARVAQDRRAGDRRPARGALYITTNRKVALPPRHELATSMEALIHHFKLVTEGFRVPPGEVYARDRVAARRARLLRGGRRLGQARARAHARPELREPPGAAGHGARTR